MDHETFEPLGRWEVDRGPQQLAYDFWWHLGYDTMITSEWGTPNMVEAGSTRRSCSCKAATATSCTSGTCAVVATFRPWIWARSTRWCWSSGPPTIPNKTYGFAGVVVSLKDLSASIWLWYRENGKWAIHKVIEIPAEPADPDQLPPLLKGFGAVPPLVTDINLSLDDRFLYVSCWGTGEMRQYDVSDPFNPRHTGSVHLGGIVRKTAHPKTGQPLNGGPQMVEVSRDGRRVYFSNSLYSAWDEQFYPEGIHGWIAKVDANPDGRLHRRPRLLHRLRR